MQGLGCSLVNHELGFIFFSHKEFERSRFHHKVADEWERGRVAKGETVSQQSQSGRWSDLLAFCIKTGMDSRI